MSGNITNEIDNNEKIKSLVWLLFGEVFLVLDVGRVRFGRPHWPFLILHKVT